MMTESATLLRTQVTGELRTGYVTTRELVVWREIASGFQNHEIASRLGVSIKTVEKHRTNLNRKLGTHCPAGLVRSAIERGVVTVQIRPLELLTVGKQERWLL